MNKDKYTQEILDNLLTLPENKIAEVADFVHFLVEKEESIALHKTGLTRKEASDLRTRLSTFEDDWNAPGMEAYDSL